MSNLCRVLSIDGGGIRGIIPAMVLEALEARAGKPVCEMFDLVAGTSTGGLLAMALTRPGPSGRPRFTARQMVEFYEQEGPAIFSRTIWHRLRAGGIAFEEKYSNEMLRRLLDRKLGDTCLADALTELLVPAYDIEQREALFFTKDNPATARLQMVDVAMATAAAPTYFEPWKIQTPDDVIKYRAFVDGGVFANNPAMCAFVEARKIFTEATDFMVVSVGTGQLTRRIPYEDACDWGLIGWAQPLLGVVFDGVSDTVDYQLQRLLPDCPDGSCRYHRYQLRLDEGSDDMDDAGKTNLRVLKLRADKMIKDRSKDLVKLAADLAAATPAAVPV